MHWKSYLRVQTRNPQFLWRVVLAILLAGGVVAIGVNLILQEPLLLTQAKEVLDRLESPDAPWPELDNSTRSRLEAAIEAGDWWRVWWLVPIDSWFDVELGPAIIAGLTALFWLLFTLQVGHADSPRCVLFWLCLVAVVLGAISTWPTLFMYHWQEHELEFAWRADSGLAAQLKYFILGVGGVEEGAKLLLFLPLVPLLVARRNELERLVVASCVGLGFAAEENVTYFAASVSRESVGRYLTANFFHMVETGLAGLWLCRAIRWPKECGLQFLAYFGLIILAHGAYDAFILVPELAQYAMGSTLIFILMVYLYFREVRELRPARREVVSLTANFVVGLALLVAITFVYITAQVGLKDAGRTFLQPAIATSLMAYVFLREVPESLVQT